MDAPDDCQEVGKDRSETINGFTEDTNSFVEKKEGEIQQISWKGSISPYRAWETPSQTAGE